MRVAVLVACVVVLSFTAPAFGAPYAFTRVIDSTSYLSGMRAPELNDHGQVAFYGFFDDADFHLGVFTAGNGVPLTTVADVPYDAYPAPPSINNHGAIAFRRLLNDDTSFGDISVWQNGAITTIATANANERFYELSVPRYERPRGCRICRPRAAS